MPQGSHAQSPKVARKRRAWRGASFVASVAGGFLFFSSYSIADGSEIRAASVTDLASLVQRQRQDTDATLAEARALAEEVRRLSRSSGGTVGDRIQRQIDALMPIAGMTEVNGSGIVVTLTDAPPEVVSEALREGSPPAERLVVHQQDIQAVINALLVGGAQAISVQDQRVISTTGIKCVGNTVILHGVPYSPPYRIAAVGDPVQLQQALDDSDYLAAYRQTVAEYALGYQVSQSLSVRIPAYTGITKLRYASPAPATSKSKMTN